MPKSILWHPGKDSLRKDNVASRVIRIEKISEHDLMIDVGMLSVAEDFTGIESISLPTSSTVGGSGSSEGSTLKVPSDRRALIRRNCPTATFLKFARRLRRRPVAVPSLHRVSENEFFRRYIGLVSAYPESFAWLFIVFVINTTMAYVQEESRYRVCLKEAIVSGDRERSQPARRNS